MIQQNEQAKPNGCWAVINWLAMWAILLWIGYTLDHFIMKYW